MFNSSQHTRLHAMDSAANGPSSWHNEWSQYFTGNHSRGSIAYGDYSDPRTQQLLESWRNKSVGSTYPEPHMSTRVLLGFIYVCTIVICGLGNLVICWAAVRYKRMRTATNLLLLNLLVSDMIVALVSLPLFLHNYLTGSWAFNKHMCAISGYLKNASLYVSCNTLLAIAVMRTWTFCGRISWQSYFPKTSHLIVCHH